MYHILESLKSKTSFMGFLSLFLSFKTGFLCSSLEKGSCYVARLVLNLWQSLCPAQYIVKIFRCAVTFGLKHFFFIMYMFCVYIHCGNLAKFTNYLSYWDLKTFFSLILFICVYSYVPWHVWNSEDNLQEPVLSFHMCVQGHTVRSGGSALI